MTYEIWGTENNARENTAKSIYRDFIGSLPTGGYVVGWLEGSELFFQLYNAFGQKVGGPRPVPTGAGIGQSIASIEAVGTDGSFAIAWNENTGQTNGFAIKSSVFNPDGSPVAGSTHTHIENQSLGGTDTPAMARNGNSGFITVYETSDEIRYSTQNLDGSATSDVRIAQAAGLQYPDVTELGGGKFLVSYTKSGTIQYRLIDLNVPGATVGAEVAVGTGFFSDTVVFRDAAGAATGYAITYSNGANVITQFYSLAGVKGSALQLTSNGLNDGDYISATAMQDGRVAVVYSEWSPEDNGDIYLRVVSANGTATDKLLLNARSVLDHTGQQYTPKVTEMADGRLSVTWYDGSLGRGLITNTIVDARIAPVIVRGTNVADTYVGTKIDVPVGDELYGNGGNDTLIGGLGGDKIDGGADTDTASFVFATAGVVANLATGKGTGGEANGDTYISIENLLGSAHGDVLIGSAGGNALYGEGGNDTLSGGAGADLLVGGSGSDFVTYSDSAAGVVVNLGAGTGAGGDAEGDAFAEIENIVGSEHADSLIGNGAGNYIGGGAGNDIIDGNAGADVLAGGAGDDVYYVDNGGDQIFENGGEGYDTVFASSTFALAANVEKLVANGWAPIALYGNALDNLIEGNAADNVIDGGIGADTMSGGGGNDRYYIDNINDVIVDSSGSDTLVLAQGVVIDFTSEKYAAIENIEISGTTKDLSGNEVANHLVGNTFANVIWGYGGNDTIEGLSGNDALYGGNGNDILRGGVGNDTLRGEAGNDLIYGDAGRDNLFGGVGNDTIYGGADNDTLKGETGRDVFAFNTTLHKTRNVDKIVDFKVRDDTIWLENAVFRALSKSGSVNKPKALTSDAFWTGSSAHDANDRIIYDKKTGALYYDADGIGGKAQIKFATISKNLALTKADFYII